MIGAKAAIDGDILSDGAKMVWVLDMSCRACCLILIIPFPAPRSESCGLWTVDCPIAEMLDFLSAEDRSFDRRTLRRNISRLGQCAKIGGLSYLKATDGRERIKQQTAGRADI